MNMQELTQRLTCSNDSLLLVNSSRITMRAVAFNYFIAGMPERREGNAAAIFL